MIAVAVGAICCISVGAMKGSMKGVGATEHWQKDKWPCDETSQLQIAWWYNWGPLNTCKSSSAEFVPMVWSGTDIARTIASINTSA